MRLRMASFLPKTVHTGRLQYGTPYIHTQGGIYRGIPPTKGGIYRGIPPGYKGGVYTTREE